MYQADTISNSYECNKTTKRKNGIKLLIKISLYMEEICNAKYNTPVILVTNKGRGRD